MNVHKWQEFPVALVRREVNEQLSCWDFSEKFVGVVRCHNDGTAEVTTRLLDEGCDVSGDSVTDSGVGSVSCRFPGG